MKKVRASRKDGLPAQAAKVFQTLETILGDFPNIGKNVAGALEALSREEKLTFSGAGLTEISQRLKKLIEDGLNAERYKLHHAPIRAFARYAAAVAAAYEERKRQLAALDFDDLLIKARDLLCADGAAAPPFEFLIVDEVQDTSRVQCEIIEKLWTPGSNGLVICGDTKQSIYAWRNADPRVMPDLEKTIGGVKTSHRIALRASFRSKDSILDLVNLLFQQVYGEHYAEDEQLVAAEEKNGRARGRGEKPCVELLTAPWEGEADAVPDIETRVRAEMTAVADRIRLLVEGPAQWKPVFRYSDDSERFDRAGKGNAFRYADILILLRRTSQQQVLEHTLRQHGIPYRIGGRGKGLFARPEAKDLMLFLKVLTHPFDTIALIGFLRSPWAGLSDEAILQLGWTARGFSEAAFRDNVFSGTFDGDPEQAQRLARASERITRFRAQADFRLASELVRELIQETGYDAIIAGTFRGGQRLADLRKLLDWIRSAEHGGTVLLADVAAALEAYADDPPDIPEAALLDPDQNAVTIMTIHGAKGLTARVVFVPELCARPSGDSPWALLTDAAASEPSLQVRTEDLGREKTMTPGFDLARQANTDVRDAEAKNVFYVAMTRARDLVVLSGPCGGRKPAEWRREINQLLETSPESKELVRVIGFDELHAAAGKPEGAPSDVVPAPEVFHAVTERFAPTAHRPSPLRFPATILSAYHGSAKDFVRTTLPGAEPFWLRRPRHPDEAEGTGEDAPPAADTDAFGSYAEFGTAGHAALEQLALSGWRGDVRALAQAAGLGPANAEDLEQRLARALAEVRGLSAGAAELNVEWPFALMIEDDGNAVIVDGTIDLFFQSADGGWQIVDYKFTDEPTAELLRKYGLQLNLYRLALDRLLGDRAQNLRASLMAIGRDTVRRIEVPPDPATGKQAVAAAVSLHDISVSTAEPVRA